MVLKENLVQCNINNMEMATQFSGLIPEVTVSIRVDKV